MMKGGGKEAGLGCSKVSCLSDVVSSLIDLEERQRGGGGRRREEEEEEIVTSSTCNRREGRRRGD